MKKIFCIFSLVFFLLVGSVSVFADPHIVPDDGEMANIISEPISRSNDSN